MIGKFYSFWFLIEMVIAAASAAFGYFSIKHYWKNGSFEINRDHFKMPTSTVLIVIGIVTPILATLASLLYTMNPKGQYVSLLSGKKGVRSQHLTLFTMFKKNLPPSYFVVRGVILLLTHSEIFCFTKSLIGRLNEV